MGPQASRLLAARSDDHGEAVTMSQQIRTLTLPLPLGLGTVNCYLVEVAGGFVLVDTAGRNCRTLVHQGLVDAGCRPGDLPLVVLTHGDFDHIGNAAHLRNQFGANVAIHPDDAGMIERGDMFWNRRSGNAVLRLCVPLLFRFDRADRLKPDLYLADGDDLSKNGLDGRVIHLPGHSRGSIGILTADGDLFCGDLLENRQKPARNSIMDDANACEASIARLATLPIQMIYPGHGKAFSMDQWIG